MNSESSSTLILFTDEFPFAKGETFIENEIEYLALAFKKVYIVSKDVKSVSCRETPSNVVVLRESFNFSAFEKISALGQIISSTFWQELRYLMRRNITVSKTNISYMLLSLKRAKKVTAYIGDIVKKQKITGNTFLYSYWCMDESIGISLYKKKNPGVKAFTRAHRMDLYFYSNSNGYIPYKQLIINSLDAFFSISKDGIDYLKNDLNLKLTDRVKLSYLGTNKFIEQQQAIVKRNSNSVMSCSNIYPNKRVHLIAKGLTKIEPKVIWDHYGEYMNFTSSEYKSLLNDALSQASKNHQCNMKGRISNNELLKTLSTTPYDLFINLSESEGVPVSIMEAFSFGIPVIATNVGGVAEIITHGENGYLLPSDCSEDLVGQTIDDFYKLSLEEQNKLRQNAYNTWNTKFNAEKNYISFINDILAL